MEKGYKEVSENKKKVHVQIKKSVPFCFCEATWRETKDQLRKMT